MATVEALRVRCPECGATLKASGDVVKCEYCSTESRVQRRTEVLQRKVELPPPQAHYPTPIAVQKRKWTVKTVLPIAVPVIGPAIILSAIFIWQDHQTQWLGKDTIVMDVDGDGTSDAIGVVRWTLRDKMKIRAVSGKDGHVIWETASRGNYLDVYQDWMAWQGSTLMVVGKTIDGYAMTTGAKLWSVKPPEAVSRLCASGSTELLITKDTLKYSIDLATGELAQVMEGTCPSSGESQATYDHRMKFRSPRSGDNVFSGMTTDELMDQYTPPILCGVKKPGTAIPMLAAVDPSDQLLWQDQVTTHEAMDAKDALFDANETVVAAVWKWRSSPHDPGLAAWDRKTGKRLWESHTNHGGNFSASLQRIVVASNVIFVATNQDLQAFDPQTGARRFTEGTTK